MTSFARLVLVIVLAAGAIFASAAAGGGGKGGPSPGVQFAGEGIASASGARYVARVRQGTTVVTAYDADGRLRRGTVEGAYGVPLVAFDGTLGGLAHDGRSLVLASPRLVGGTTWFSAISTKTLEPIRMIGLRGRWSYDALSPDGRTLYLVEHSPTVTYRVRAYDVAGGRLLKEAVIDPRLGGRAMTGMPVTRATGPRGVWEYTLYQKPQGLPFVHALDTVRGKALCIELPWRGEQSRLFLLRMRVDGRKLVLTRSSGGTVATIDTRAFRVHAHHNPLATPR